MCIFDFIFYLGCGHTGYRFHRRTSHTCGPHNICGRPSLESMGEDSHDLIHDSIPSKSRCSLCLAGVAIKAVDPFLKTVKAIVGLLGRDLDNLKETEGMQAMLALQAVQLLSRISDLFSFCRESRPTREEMCRHIGFAIEGVGKAIREGGKRDTRKLSFSTNSTSSESSGPEIQLPTLKTTLSQGTIDRQLCGLNATAPRHVPSYNYPSSTCETQFSIAAPPETAPSIDLMKESLLSRSTEKNSRESDEDSVITNPFDSSVPSTGCSSRTLPMSCHPSTAETYLGRDDWECDFCGLECFCSSLDD